jgi:thiol-disulfide isomerase/thioredoxin
MRLSPRLLVLVALSIAGGFFLGRAFWWRPAPVEPPRPGTGAPAITRVPVFTLPDLDGTPRSIADWTDQTLIINFWATWCAPCRKEMPLLQQVHSERAGQQFAVIGIAIDRPEPVRTFVAEAGVTYPILVGQQDAMAVAESFGRQFVGLPLSVVSLPGGEIVKLHLGELHPEDLRAILEATDAVRSGQLTVAEARQRLQAPET